MPYCKETKLLSRPVATRGDRRGRGRGEGERERKRRNGEEGRKVEGEEKRGEETGLGPYIQGSPSLHPEEMEEEEETRCIYTGLFTHLAVRPLEY